MKKFLFICLSILCAASIYADGYKTCKIAGTTGTVEVSVYETDTENGIATVRFSNDTDVPANVTVSIVFKNSNNGIVATKSITKRVPAQFECSENVSCGKAYKTVDVSTIRGNKCSN